MSILIKNISYLDIENEKIVDNIDILIEGNVFKKIGTNLNMCANKIIDGNNMLATPGFINSHTHLGMSYFRNYADDLSLMDWLQTKIWPIEDKLNDDDIYWSSVLSLIENIKSGVTTVCDMYCSMDKVADATILLGIRGVLTRGLTDFDGKGKQKLLELDALYNKYNNAGNGRIKIVPGPHAIYTCSTEYLKEISKLAKEKYDNIINIHLSETITEIEDSKKQHNLTPIEYISSIGLLENHVIAAHCVHITDEEIELIKGKDFYPVYNPSSNLKLASGFTPINKLLKNKITVGIGTDGDSSNNNQDILEEIHIGGIVNKAIEMNEKVVPAIEMLKMVTINGATSLGLKNLGVIKEGFLADLNIFNLDSNSFTPRNNLISALVYSAKSSDIQTVICNGKIVMEDQKILSVNEKDIRNIIQTRWEEIQKR